MTLVLYAAIYVMAAATLSLGLKLSGMVNGQLAVLAGVMCLLALMQTHMAISTTREKRRARNELAELRAITKAFAATLSETHTRIEDVRAAGEASASAQNKKIVSGLRVLENLVREFAGRLSQKSPAPVAEAPDHRIPTSARAELAVFDRSELLETIRAALEENRIDVYLQPVVSLPQRKLRFYEALSRLRTEEGRVIMPSQYMRLAGPAGLMSVVDNLLLFRCVQIMRRLIQKNREIGLFCNISSETLGDAEFFPQFLEYMHHNRDLAPQIVFEFSQDAILRTSEKDRENLACLSRMGYGLSMDHVETLAMDLPSLSTLGFRYMKVGADTLTRGMQEAHAPVAAEDLKQLFARHDIALIAERVENEKTVVQLLELGVDCAQGFLFGEPRAMRDDQKTLPEPTAAIVPLRRAG